MNALKLRPFIPSGADYALAQRFFEDLGFEKKYADDGLTLFRIGDQEFYLQNFENPVVQQNYMVELLVENVDGWWDRIAAAELERKYPIRIKPPEVYPWGKREIHLIDPSGVCWHISEAVSG